MKPTMTSLIVAAGTAIALAIGVVAPATATPVDPPLLVNGGFEDADFTGWTLDDSSGFTGVFCPGPGPDVAEGFCAAFTGATVDATLSQTFPTTPGNPYLVTFQYKPDGGTPSHLTASIDGVLLFSRVDLAASTDYLLGTAFFKATGATSTLTLGFRDDPGFLLLDAVAVAFAPEPGTALLLGLGLAGFALTRRRRA
jgi:hypothetical protein